MTKTIDLVDKQVGETAITLIAECNMYNEEGKLVQQLSRTKFEFGLEETDETIIEFLKQNQYSIYFE